MPIDVVLALAIAASSPGAATQQADSGQIRQTTPVVKKTKRTRQRPSGSNRERVPIRTEQTASDPAGTVPPGAPGTDDPLLPGSKPNR